MKSDMLRKAIVTGLGTGYLRPAPGSWGSLAVCAIFLALVWASVGAVVVNVAMALVAVGATAGCIALGGFTEETFGRKDPGRCTLDEWAGQAVSLLGLPLGASWGRRLVATGTALRLWSISYLGRSARTRKDKARRLVTTGPFSLCRNPIYMANMVGACGFIVLCEVLWCVPILSLIHI